MPWRNSERMRKKAIGSGWNKGIMGIIKLRKLLNLSEARASEKAKDWDHRTNMPFPQNQERAGTEIITLMQIRKHAFCLYGSGGRWCSTVAQW